MRYLEPRFRVVFDMRAIDDVLLTLSVNGRTLFWGEFNREPSPNANHHIGWLHWSLFR